VVSTDTKCTLKTADTDFPASLASVTCSSSCTADATNDKCTALKSTFKSDAGIKAAYCTDEFLVIWATAKPSYEPSWASDYLNLIPLPPGGDDGCRVRTGYDLLTVWKVPLTPPADQDGTNVMGADGDGELPGVPGMPAAGAIGVGIDGVPM
jgi:hypothetical protein